MTFDDLASEVFRQVALLEAGGTVAQETRGFDEDAAETFSLRSKEDAPDYRYMPDPNLPPVLLDPVHPHQCIGYHFKYGTHALPFARHM